MSSPHPTRTGRDISWGADCDACGTRLTAARAARCYDEFSGAVVCGSCSDEEKAAEVRQALADLCERVERDRREPDKLLCHVQSARRALR